MKKRKRARVVRAKKVKKHLFVVGRVKKGTNGHDHKLKIHSYYWGIYDARIFGLCFYRSYKKLF